MLPEEKGKYQPSYSPFLICNSDLSEKYTGALVPKKLWEQPTTIRLDLRLPAWDGAYDWHYLGGQKPETKQAVNLGENQILLFY